MVKIKPVKPSKAKYTMQNLNEFDINKLSKHLFWDIDKNKIDADKNKKLIINRVVDYGLISDWLYISSCDNIISHFYNIKYLNIARYKKKFFDLKKTHSKK